MTLTYAIQASELILAVAVLIGLYRLVRGPSVVDRLIAFDLIVLSVVAFTALISIEAGTPHFVELILIVSLLGFFGTVALIKSLDVTEAGEDEVEP